VVPLAVPPASTVCVPTETVAPLAKPNTVWLPRLIRAPSSVPPARTVTKPPRLTVSLTARPPDETSRVPRTNVLLATPPEEM